MSKDVVGAVLAGGRGRRMGSEKTLLDVGGRTLARRAVEALHAAGLDAVLVLRRHQFVPLTAHPVAVIRDEIEDAGPMGGLHALLRWLPVEWALVVACDQPFLSPALLRGLLAETRDDIDAVVGYPGGTLEPLPGLYRRTCLPAVEEALRQGQRSLAGLLRRLRVAVVESAQIQIWDPELLSYANINTRDDLAWARRHAAALAATPQPVTSGR